MRDDGPDDASTVAGQASDLEHAAIAAALGRRIGVTTPLDRFRQVRLAALRRTPEHDRER